MATAGYGRKIYVKASSTAPIAGDLVGGLKDASTPETMNTVETTVIGGSGNTTRLPTTFDVQPTMSGDCDFSDAPQNLIRSSFRGRTLIYVTDLADATNGYTYPCYISSYQESGAPGDAASWSATFQLSGTPTVRP